MNKMMATLLLLLQAACSSYQTREDFLEARNRALAGEAEEVPPEILRALNQVPPDLRREAVSTVAGISPVDSSTSGPVLQKMLDHPVMQDPVLQGKIIEHLVERDDEGSPEVILKKVHSQPELLSEPVVNYLGEKKYSPAISDISKAIDGTKYVDTGVKALVKMGDEDATNYILSVPRQPDHPAITQSIESIPDIEDPEKESSKREVLEFVIRSETDYPETVVLLAIHTLDRMGAGYHESTYEALNKLYTTTKNEKLRDAAINAMAKMKNTTPYLLLRDARFSLIQAQAYLVLWSLDPSNVPTSDSETQYSPEPEPEVQPVAETRPPEKEPEAKPGKKAEPKKRTARNPTKKTSKKASAAKPLYTATAGS